MEHSEEAANASQEQICDVEKQCCDINLIISVIDSSVSYYALRKQHSNLLVMGYSKRSFTVNHIPQVLIDLFEMFYYEAIPSCFITGLGEINYNKCEIFRNFDKNVQKDKTYCISQIGWTSGIHEFKIKLTELANGSTGIGVATNTTGFVKFECSAYGDWAHDWAFDSKQSGNTYQMYYDNSGRYRNWYYDGIYVHDKGKETLSHKLRIKWENNDIIGCKVDCDEWKLTFYINNKPVGNVLHLVQNMKYYPAVAFGGCNCTKLQFIECS